MSRVGLTFLLLFFFASLAECDDRSASAGSWKLESVQLADGKVRRGLILSQNERELELAEVVQPAAKPMYLIVWPISMTEVVKQNRLPSSERKKLQRRIRRYRNRARILAGALDRISLEKSVRDDQSIWTYGRREFQVESSLDEAETRRAIVAVEQINRALRLYLPPRVNPERPVLWRLFDSEDEYRLRMQERGLAVKNPAVFFPKTNEIWIGTNWEAVRSQSRRIIEECNRRSDSLEQERRDLTKQLAKFKKRIIANGMSGTAATNEISLRRTTWEKSYKEKSSELAVVRRQAEVTIDASRLKMHGRIYHEAFHAYLENSLFPSKQYAVPHWLNEGLAQVFQAGRIEDDALRINNPPKRPRLHSKPRLRNYLTKNANRRTCGLAMTDETDYYNSRLLGFDLLINHRLHDRKVFEKFVADSAERPLKAFEELVGVPLSEYEAALFSG